MLPDESISLLGSPFEIQHLIFRCVELSIVTASRDTTLTTTLEAADGGAIVLVTGDELVADVAPSVSRIALLTLLAAEMGADLKANIKSDHPLSLSLLLPKELRSIFGA